MSTEEQKLERFTAAVYSEVEERADKILNDAKDEAQKLINEAQISADIHTTEQKSSIDKEMTAKTTRAESSAQLESKRSVLIHREKLVNSLFDDISASLADFAKSDDYKNYLQNKLDDAKKLYPAESGVVQISRNDEKYTDFIKSAGDFSVEIKKSIMLGGLCVCYPQMNILLDYTLDSQLEEQRTLFSEKCRDILAD